jgi:hypothetical protein
MVEWLDLLRNGNLTCVLSRRKGRFPPRTIRASWSFCSTNPSNLSEENPGLKSVKYHTVIIPFHVSRKLRACGFGHKHGCVICVMFGLPKHVTDSVELTILVPTKSTLPLHLSLSSFNLQQNSLRSCHLTLIYSHSGLLKYCFELDRDPHVLSILQSRKWTSWSASSDHSLNGSRFINDPGFRGKYDTAPRMESSLRCSGTD